MQRWQVKTGVSYPSQSRMQPVKVGDGLACSECGVELEVTKGCGCNDCEVICCGTPMEVVARKAGGCCCRNG